MQGGCVWQKLNTKSKKLRRRVSKIYNPKLSVHLISCIKIQACVTGLNILYDKNIVELSVFVDIIYYSEFY